MPFPESPRPRTIYKKNPLNEVICQLTFPDILSIDAEQPALFQEKIRHDYPLFNQTSQDNLPAEILQHFPNQMRSLFSNSQVKYEFSSDDKAWVVSLQRNYIALTAHDYKRWEDFWARLKQITDAFSEIYKPAFFSRIGLRYQNVINKEILGLQDQEWKDLLNEFVAGELAVEYLKSYIKESHRTLLYQLPDGKGQVRIIYGLVFQDGINVGYLIDSDFYTTEKTEIDNVFTKLNDFHARNRRFFNWCITDKLHNAMVPEAVE